MISVIAGLNFNHLPLTQQRPAHTVSRATHNGVTCDVQVVSLDGVNRLSLVFHACGAEVERHILASRQVELLYRDTVQARIVGLMIPHLADTAHTWRLEGLLAHRQAA